MPTTGRPVTTSCSSPVPVTATTATRQQSVPVSTMDRASRSAERTSAWHRARGSWVTRTWNVGGPSRPRSHPRSASCSSQRGGCQPCDTPSMIHSTPSTWRPASRPGSSSTHIGVGLVDGVGRDAEPDEVLNRFALRGAPCGNRPDVTSPVDACNNEDPVAVREPGESSPVLVGDGPVALVVCCWALVERLRFLKAHPVLAQVRPRLSFVPRLVHPRHRTDGRSSATHAGLSGGLSSERQRRRGRVGGASTNPGIRTPNQALRSMLLTPRQQKAELAAETPRDSGICWRGAKAMCPTPAPARAASRDNLGGTTTREDQPHMTPITRGTRG